MIHTYDVTGSQIALGSGVFLSDEGLILTNAHVVHGAYSARVEYPGGASDAVTIFSQDDARDLAILGIEVSDVHPVTLSPIPAEVGDHVIAIGNPLGLGGTVSDGIVSGIRRVDENLELIQITVPISPGSSGGVLLNDSAEMVGLTTSTLTEGQNINFAVSIRSILQFALESSNDSSQASPRILESAEKSIWWRAALKWVLTGIIWIIALLFSDSFWFAIPILMFAGYLIYIVVKLLWKIVAYPFRAYARSRNQEVFSFDPEDYASVRDESSLIGQGIDEPIDEGLEPAVEEADFTFHCWKCAEQIVVESETVGYVDCPYCNASNQIPGH